MMKRWLDFLTFRLSRDGFAELSWRRIKVRWSDPRRERRLAIETEDET